MRPTPRGLLLRSSEGSRAGLSELDDRAPLSDPRWVNRGGDVLLHPPRRATRRLLRALLVLAHGHGRTPFVRLKGRVGDKAGYPADELFYIRLPLPKQIE